MAEAENAVVHATVDAAVLLVTAADTEVAAGAAAAALAVAAEDTEAEQTVAVAEEVARFVLEIGSVQEENVLSVGQQRARAEAVAGAIAATIAEGEWRWQVATELTAAIDC